MTECQGCGAWNDSRRAVCVLCGTPLAGTDEWDSAAEPPPLPPLPDGGLRASMPTWLREPPEPASAPLLPPRAAPPVARLDAAPPLGPRADPRTFLADDDFPQWLRDLAARRDARVAPPAPGPDPNPDPAANAPPPPHPAPDPALPIGWPTWSELAASLPAATDPESDPDAIRLFGAALTADAVPEFAPVAGPAPVPARPPAAEVAARAREERRGREPWETLLLVVLFIGVVVATLWALVANGVFSPGL